MKFLVRLLAAVFFTSVVAAFPAAAQTVVTLYSQYNAPQYVAVDANKTVFVTDTTNSLSALGLENGVYATTPIPYDTNFATVYVSPEGVAVGPDGRILSVSMGSSVPNSFFLFEFAPPDYAEIEDGSLPNNGGVMQGVAADSQGNFWVGDTNGTVWEIFASTGYQAANTFGTGQGGTDRPFGIAFDSHDNLFVADQLSGSGQILEYAAAGGVFPPRLVNTITNVNVKQPVGVAVDTRGNLYVTDSTANTLTAFGAPDYTNAQVIVSTGLSGPMGVAVDADDNIFVVDTGHNALKEVLALPAVTAVAATAGPLGGGNPVMITGVHLTGASAVSFGGTAATSFQAVSDTEVTATAPPGSAGTVDIRVTTANGTSILVPADAYTYTPAPAVGNVNRPSGPTAGGNLVFITGTNLAQVSAVSFGGTPAASFLVLSNTLLSAAVPPGAVGTVDVTVTTPGGTSATGAGDHYTYVALPVVTGISADAGPTAGGTAVTISGTHLTLATAVSFGGTAATNFVVNSDTSVTATAPAGSAGTVDVTATTAGGTSATSAADAYTYVAAPTVTLLSPSSGPTGGGTVVTITGTNLTGAASVRFGTAAAIGFTVNGATQITAVAPAGSVGAVDVTVSTTGGTSATGAADLYSYTLVPTVTALSPTGGPTVGGNTVSITGANLTGTTAVRFGGTAATNVVVVGATQVTATAPAGTAGVVDVTVTTPNGTSATNAADSYLYAAPPTVTGLNPSSGSTAGGAVVTIAGTNLTGASAVTFGTTPATSFTVVSATQITAVSPAGSAGTVDVTVTTLGGTNATGAADQYTYTLTPAVTSVSPNTGPTAAGTAVTINGANLTGTTSVKFGAAAATNVVVVSATQVTAAAPAGAPGLVDVTITTPNGISATSAADSYLYVAAPTVTLLSPSSGPTGGGTVVTITGTNLTGAASVRFGTAAAIGFTVGSATQITAVAPAGSVGAVDVTVTTTGGTSATGAADLYTYTLVPAVTVLSPSGGPTVGGNTVSITGANLTGATAVRFGATAATNVVVVGATQVTATAPAGTAGVVDVTVTTPNGTSATSAADSYLYAAPPTVTGLSPSSGSTAGGAVVTVAGTNLTGASAVKFGTTPATSFTVVSATQITAVSPAGSAGTVDVTVTTLGGTSATSAADQYTYTLTPAVASVSPNTGPTAAGTAVTINGANLTGATSVKFGAAAATNVVLVSTTQVTATAPAGTPGLVDVTVTTPNGTSATSAADSYLYVAAPTVTALSPSSGSTGGGTVVTITGTNLTGASAVKFGTVAAGFTVVSATQVTATAPAGAAGAVDVTVTTPGGTSATGAADRYTYLALPTVTALSPVTGPVAGGTPVVITGTNLTGATGVKFGTASAIFTVDSATQVTATSPAGSAGAVDVTVTTPSGTSATGAADQFTYGNGPTVGAVSPTSGPTGGGTTVTITGANLTGATAVKFGTAAAASFTVASATTITAVTPAETSGTVDVTVTTPVGTSAANAGDRFTFGGLPAVTALSPSSGPTTGGAAVTISGANFTGATAVKFGNTAATNVVVVGASQITAAAPASSAGIVDVTVTTPIGTSATSAADAYTYTAAPSVTALSPALGPTSGGTSVTITGTNLTGATAVKFGTAAAGFTVVSAMQITATAPPGAPGTVDVTVTTPNGTSAASAADRFTYTALPIVTALSPASGGTAGGTVVTITGANLTGATAVRFGALAAAGFTVGGATQITATAPAGAAGTVDVIVTTPNGTSATSAADRFTYTTGASGQVYSYQSTLGTTGTAQADNAHFSSPSAGAVDPAGNHLFVADAGNHRVQVLDTGSLAVVATIGAPGVAGSDNAHLDGPMGVGFDPMTGHVLVADTGNHRVQIFDAGSFAYLATLGVAGTAGTDNAHFDAPASVHLNPATRELYIADTGNHRVQVFGADALGYIATIGVSGVAGADTTHLDEPRDAELDPSSNQIMVADSGNARLQLFDAGTLAYTGTLGGLGLGGQDNDYLGTPVTAAFDPASNLVLVADAGTDDRVQVFDAMTYGYVLTLGTTGSSGPGNSQFAGPSGIAADPAHARLFVGDRQNDRVEVYSIALPVAFASVLPGSRSVQLGNPATIFASLINAGSTALQGCQIALPVAAPAGLTLSYQTTNPATNALTGTPNTPATIAGGDGVQSFLVSLQGTNAFTAAALPLDFDCVGVAPAPVTTGVDTVDLTLSVTPVADIIALAATPSHDGIVTVPVGGNAAFAVASTNAGAASLIIASVDTGSAILPLTATLCQSNPATGQCLATPAASVPLSFGTGAAPTFSVFLGASAPIALDPAAARIFMRFRDADGRLHGSTSVAVRAD